MFNRKEYVKQYYQNNKEKYSEMARIRYLEKGEQIKAQRRIASKQRKENPERYEKYKNYLKTYRNNNSEKRKEYDAQTTVKYKHYRNSAKRRDYDFSLTYEEFEEMYNSNCIYCGEVSHGVDRLDNSIGYTTENSAPCCGFCNKMKWIHDKSSFLEQIKKIYLNNL